MTEYVHLTLLMLLQVCVCADVHLRHVTASNRADVYFALHVSLIHQGSSLQTDAHTD